MNAAVTSLRSAIEAVDARLIAAIAERVALACDIGREKAAAGIPIIDPAREAQVVSRAASLAREAGLPEDDVRALYWRLMAMSRRAQIPDEAE